MVLLIDGDAFFVACERLRNKTLIGKPVVTGVERGIASAVSYEAKARGIYRGMPIAHIRQHYPDIIVVSSSQRLYRTISRQVFALVRRYTQSAEPYSIDECFAYVSDGKSITWYQRYMDSLRRAIAYEIGISVSIGCGQTKTQAKLAIQAAKPAGVACFDQVWEQVAHVRAEELWGIGSRTALSLARLGIRTVADMYHTREAVLLRNFSKPVIATWHELHGRPMIGRQQHDTPQTMRVSKTITPTTDLATLWRALAVNVEQCARRLRHGGYVTDRVEVFIKEQSFAMHRMQIEQIPATCDPRTLLSAIEPIWQAQVSPGRVYRTTGITATITNSSQAVQASLFDTRARVDTSAVIEDIRARHGARAIHTGAAIGKDDYDRTAVSMLRIPYLGSIS